MEKINAKRIWFIADIHFGIGKNNLEDLMLHTQYFYDFLFPLLESKKRDGDVMINLGDIFDSRQLIHSNTFNVAYDVFEKLSKMIDIYSIVGNHDCYEDDSTEKNSSKMLKPFFKELYIKPTLVETQNKLCLFMPFSNNDRSVLKQFKDENIDYVFSHTLLDEAKFNRTKPVGDVEYADICEESYLEKKNIRMISGHIHFTQKTKNTLYVGSIRQFTKNDVGNKKGIFCLDVETGKFNFYENNVSPKFVKVLYDDVINDKDKVKEKVKGNFVFIEADLKETDIINEELLKDVLNESIKYRVDKDTIKILEENSTQISLKNFNIEDLLKEYLGNKEYKSEEQKTKTLEIADKIIKENTSRSKK